MLIAAFVAGVILTEKPAGGSQVYVGMCIAYGGEETAMNLIDTVSNYTNLIILGSLNLTMNTAALTRVCNHLYEKGLNFIIYVGWAKNGVAPPCGPEAEFFANASQRWGDRFLGVYMFDEVGGRLIDDAHSVDMTYAQNYSQAAVSYVNQTNYFLRNASGYYNPAAVKLFSSDYALFWYDYLSGYDVVLGQYVGNQSRQLTNALCRGAATALNKDWGIIITYSDKAQPYMEEPAKLYGDMVTAYQNGAKYIVVFNSPENNSQSQFGGLTAQHLDAMKSFWSYMKNTPNTTPVVSTAFVLPKDYGYGLRGPNDKIWGKWQADSLSEPLWIDLTSQMTKYGSNLDIVYEAGVGNQKVTLPYDRLVFWNGTTTQK